MQKISLGLLILIIYHRNSAIQSLIFGLFLNLSNMKSLVNGKIFLQNYPDTILPKNYGVSTCARRSNFKFSYAENSIFQKPVIVGFDASDPKFVHFGA